MIIFYILLMVVKVFWKPFRIWITRSIIFPTFMFYILPPQVKLRTVAGAKSPTALVASGRMSTGLKYFFIAKSLRRKALRKGRKDPTRRWGQWDSHRRVLIGQGWPLFHCKKWLSQTSKSIRDFFFFSFFFSIALDNSAWFVHRLGFKVNRRSRVSETSMSRIVTLYCQMEKKCFSTNMQYSS